MIPGDWTSILILVQKSNVCQEEARNVRVQLSEPPVPSAHLVK